jgi:hypothetical protein
MNNPIKKLPGKVASLLKRIQQINFKSEKEIIEAHEQSENYKWAVYQYRHKRFDYYFNIFDLEEGCPFDDLTERQSEQYSLLWKLVDLEVGYHE